MIFTKMKMLKEYNKKCRAAEYYRYEYMITKVFKYWKH